MTYTARRKKPSDEPIANQNDERFCDDEAFSLIEVEDDDDDDDEDWLMTGDKP